MTRIQSRDLAGFRKDLPAERFRIEVGLPQNRHVLRVTRRHCRTALGAV